MPLADPTMYLHELVAMLKKPWPETHLVNIVCHGHSVPAGYFAAPFVDTFNAYPHLLHRALKERFPFAVMNVIVTAIGGEHSESGAERLERDVLCHRPEVLTIDYALNDSKIGLERAKGAWQGMIERAKERGIKVILCTPTPDSTQSPQATAAQRARLQEHARQIRELAAKNDVGLADSLVATEHYQRAGGSLSDLLSWNNHPSRRGHELVVLELMRWFPIEDYELLATLPGGKASVVSTAAKALRKKED